MSLGETYAVQATDGLGHQFTIKDSGARQSFAGGMVRDVTTGKINYALTADGPMLKRWAVHLTKGAEKYAARNWMLATGSEELERGKESAFRHFMQWFMGEEDEDHASAVFFNINEVEYIRNRQREERQCKMSAPSTSQGLGTIASPYAPSSVASRKLDGIPSVGGSTCTKEPLSQVSYVPRPRTT